MIMNPVDGGRVRVGVAFTPFETRAEVIVQLAIRADESGLGHVDVAEGWTDDSMILLAELALRTSRIDLGTSVISAWGRTPATIALGAAGLQRCSGGRFSLGIGAGSPPLSEDSMVLPGTGRARGCGKPCIRACSRSASGWPPTSTP